MAVHLEFVVPGPPISYQQKKPQGKANLAAWRTAVGARARSAWAKPMLLGELKTVIINFYAGNWPTIDVDNMSKPILDAMETIVYQKDRQITQAEISHLRIDSPFCIAGASKLLIDALQAAKQFVYVRVEDPANPYPLPR